jgi:hypothetical protein
MLSSAFALPALRTRRRSIDSLRGSDLLSLIDRGTTIDFDPPLRKAGRTFNLSSDANSNYLTAAIIASSNDSTFCDGSEACTH